MFQKQTNILADFFVCCSAHKAVPTFLKIKHLECNKSSHRRLDFVAWDFLKLLLKFSNSLVALDLCFVERIQYSQSVMDEKII